jgi:hypothetical protein
MITSKKFKCLRGIKEKERKKFYSLKYRKVRTEKNLFPKPKKEMN